MTSVSWRALTAFSASSRWPARAVCVGTTTCTGGFVVHRQNVQYVMKAQPLSGTIVIEEMTPYNENFSLNNEFKKRT